MTDPTESTRRQMLAEINAAPGSREYLEPSTARSGTPTSSRRTSRCSASWPR